ncbi:hypothetical protein EV645_3990 [Kribbella rubisoli]|uniref:Uncharacterized protein n=1 Tax=Kribbella rubisoli TaxID=3075929 RepID=A0A4Q7X2Q4_9ACTN|nr:hypothetical protein [Kribbella rubisoli]RZU16425.1 hypothetical protein EV645_3990 [Kribbella rubisoli]
MTSKEPSEAEVAIAIAEAFSRKPPQWAVEARQRELREAGEPTMSVNEALNVKIAEAFGSVDPARLAEADRVFATPRSSTATAGDLQGRMTALIGEVAAEAQRTMGLSPERAKLEAQSQAMLCRENSKSVAAAVTALERHRDAMRQSPGVRR